VKRILGRPDGEIECHTMTVRGWATPDQTKSIILSVDRETETVEGVMELRSE